MRDIRELKMLQALPLDIKVQKTKLRIAEWVEEYGKDGVYVSFSGGKDSTVLLDIVRKMYPDIEAIFVNTGLEYPSVRKFALSHKNTKEISPKVTFKEVLIKCGYPVISKEVAKRVYEYRKFEGTKDFEKRMTYQEFNGLRKQPDGTISCYNKKKYKFLLNAPFEMSHFCCLDMKELPCFCYEEETGKKPIIATMAEESRARTKSWLESGCNAFDSDRPNSQPMLIWTSNDVLTYIRMNNLTIADAYGRVIVENNGIEGQINIAEILNDYRECRFCTTGCQRTGCIFCLFGITQDQERILRVQRKEPRIADYMLRGGAFDEKGMWKPSNKGLGFWFVIKWLEIHGNLYIPFKNYEIYEEKYGNEQTKELLKRQEEK